MINRPVANNPARPSVAIMELERGGHRPFYLRLLASAAGSEHSTIYGSTELLCSPEFAIHFGENQDLASVARVDLGVSSTSKRKLVTRFARLASNSRSEILVVPNADRLLPHLLLVAMCHRRRLGAMRFLIMRTSAAGGAKSRFNHRVKAFMVRALLWAWPDSRGFFLTDGLHYVKHRAGYDSLVPLQDPAYDIPPPSKESARARFGLSSDASIVGILGAVNERKQPKIVVDAVARLADVQLLVGGQSDDGAIERALAEFPKVRLRTKWLNSYLTNDDLIAAAAACDVIVVSQDTDAPSGILLVAVLAGVPVVAVASPWVRTVVTGARLGVEAPADGEGLSAAIAHILSQTETYRGPIAAAQADLDPDSLSILVSGGS